MKYYAKLKVDTVTEVVVVDDADAPDDQTGTDYLADLTGWPDWVATPRPDGSAAWISGKYDAASDSFPPPPPALPPEPELSPEVTLEEGA